MATPKKDRKSRPLYQRIAIDVAGFGLMIIAPLLGWLPGPGGIPLFLAGLWLVSHNHEWAENLLRDFDKKRRELANKYLISSPGVSRSVDAVSAVAFVGGVYLASAQDSLVYRFIGSVLIVLGLIVIFSNQKRFNRLAAWFKSKR